MKIVYWLLGVIIALWVISCIQSWNSTQKLIAILEKQQEIIAETHKTLVYYIQVLQEEGTEVYISNDEE